MNKLKREKKMNENPLEVKKNSKTFIHELGDSLSPFQLFSVLLQWDVLKSNKVNLNFVPIEYLEYLAYTDESSENYSINILIMLLFTEHFQLDTTGEKKIQLEDEKYTQMAKQFSFYCYLELLRRNNGIKEVSIEFIFDPNIKTELTIMPKETGKDFQDHIKSLNMVLT